MDDRPLRSVTAVGAASRQEAGPASRDGTAHFFTTGERLSSALLASDAPRSADP